MATQESAEKNFRAAMGIVNVISDYYGRDYIREKMEGDRRIIRAMADLHFLESDIIDKATSNKWIERAIHCFYSGEEPDISWGGGKTINWGV